MKKADKPGQPLSERVYRLRLFEGLFQEATFRSSLHRVRGGGGGKREASSVEGEAGAEARAEEKLQMDDLIQLKDQLPMPESEDAVEGMDVEIREALKKCRSELMRDVPPANIAHFIRTAYRASQREYVPTYDEVPLV